MAFPYMITVKVLGSGSGTYQLEVIDGTHIRHAMPDKKGIPLHIGQLRGEWLAACIKAGAIDEMDGRFFLAAPKRTPLEAATDAIVAAALLVACTIEECEQAGVPLDDNMDEAALLALCDAVQAYRQAKAERSAT